MISKNRLIADKIVQTIEQLELRIADRFPESGLRKRCQELTEIAKKAQLNIEWISKPHIPLRIASYVVILVGAVGLIFSLTVVEFKIVNTTLGNIVTITEAIFNDIVLLGAAIFFLITVESRVKRKKALTALNELRVVAHVIDMHQLTKDPTLIGVSNNTKNSPKRTLTNFELQRYLDYCSEAFSLIGKVAALYSQSLPDTQVVTSVNEIEELSTGLSRKVWQKIVMIKEQQEHSVSQ